MQIHSLSPTFCNLDLNPNHAHVFSTMLFQAARPHRPLACSLILPLARSSFFWLAHPPSGSQDIGLLELVLESTDQGALDEALLELTKELVADGSGRTSFLAIAETLLNAGANPCTGGTEDAMHLALQAKDEGLFVTLSSNAKASVQEEILPVLFNDLANMKVRVRVRVRDPACLVQ